MNVMLSVPGPSVTIGTLQGVTLATGGRHAVTIVTGSCAWDGFNGPWVEALNAAERGEITHFAMLHADVAPEAGWLDVLLDELERTAADVISVVIPLKDARGVCSCGIGDPRNPWKPLRRLTMREIMALPETFGIEDLGPEYAGCPLLHNHGCFAADLRRPIFHETDHAGNAHIYFDFPRRVRRLVGALIVECESEDWFISRKLWEHDAKTVLTRKVAVSHIGEYPFRNSIAWGSNTCDVEAGMTVPIGHKEAECPSP